MLVVWYSTFMLQVTRIAAHLRLLRKVAKRANLFLFSKKTRKETLGAVDKILKHGCGLWIIFSICALHVRCPKKHILVPSVSGSVDYFIGTRSAAATYL